MSPEIRYIHVVIFIYYFLSYIVIMIFKFPFSASHEFIQQRRKCLKRFLHLVVRHPVLTHDPIVKYFLTFNGTVSVLYLLKFILSTVFVVYGTQLF